MGDAGTEVAAAAAAPPASGRRLFPAADWIRAYRGAWFRADLVAGVTLAAYLLPSSIGNASLAGLPPEAGLYACLFAGLVFWAFCGSRHTSIAVTSAISLLVGSSLGELAGGDPARFAALASGLAVAVAALALVCWLLGAGEVVQFVSETVLVGFKAGVALVLASTQLPKLCGFKGTEGNFWERVHHFVAGVGGTHGPSIAVGLGALALLLLGKRFLPNRPTALFVVVGGIVLASVFHLAEEGVKTIGAVPQGLPPLRLPDVTLREEDALLPLAAACFLLAAVETAAVGRTFARKHGYRLDANQEFLALAAGNLASGLGGGYPISGGMSQSVVNEGGGARTPLSTLVAAGVFLAAVLFLSAALADLPQPVLAAIVLVAVLSLFKVDAMRRIWRFSRAEFALMAASLLGVLCAGLLRGVLIGAVLSIVMLLRRSARPRTSELGRVPGSDYYADVERHPENEVRPEAMVFRVEGPLLYFNAEHVRDRFFERLADRGPSVRRAVFFMGGVPGIDLAGAEMLTEIRRDASARGIEFRLAELRDRVCEALQASGYEEGGARLVSHQRIAAILDEPLPPAAAAPPP